MPEPLESFSNLLELHFCAEALLDVEEVKGGNIPRPSKAVEHKELRC